MTPRARNRMVAIILVVLGLSIAVGLGLYGLSSKITYFMTPSDIVAGKLGERRQIQPIRLGGMVKEGTLQRQADTYTFVVTDFDNNISVLYRGILPDLFREKQGVIAVGKYNPASKVFLASEILAKHDENYMPPDVKKAMDRQAKP